MSIIRGAERRESMLVLTCAMAIGSCGDDGAQSTDSAVVASIPSTTSASGATLPPPPSRQVRRQHGEPRRASSRPPSASSTVGTRADTPEATGGVDGPVVYAAAPNELGVMAAGGTGPVELVGMCLFLGAEVGARPVIVWPFGTTWSDDESAVILPDHSAVPIGSTISAGGGYLDRHNLTTSSGSPIPKHWNESEAALSTTEPTTCSCFKSGTPRDNSRSLTIPTRPECPVGSVSSRVTRPRTTIADRWLGCRATGRIRPATRSELHGGRQATSSRLRVRYPAGRLGPKSSGDSRCARGLLHWRYRLPAVFPFALR